MVQDTTIGMISQESLQQMMYASEGHQSGSLGWVSWQVDYKLDKKNLPSGYAKVKLQLLGCEVVNMVLDSNNPKVEVKKTICGFETGIELGMDMDSYSVYYVITISGFTFRHTVISFPMY